MSTENDSNELPLWCWVLLGLFFVGLIAANVHLMHECEAKGLIALYREYACVAGVRP